jgi:hypothetical protein
VQTAKNILKKNTDPYEGLLAYRSAPLRNGYSPAELLMARHLRTTLPSLRPVPVIDKQTLNAKEEDYRNAYAKDYNRRHKAKELPPLHTGEKVWVRDMKREETVVAESATNPRSYIMDSGLNRNRTALVPVEQEEKQIPSSPASPAPSGTPTQESQVSPPKSDDRPRSSFGRLLKPRRIVDV